MTKLGLISRAPLAIVLGVTMLGATTDAPAPSGPVTDTYFGTPVTDPYRILETNASARHEWMSAQLEKTHAMLVQAHTREGFTGAAAAPPGLENLTVSHGRAFYVRYAGRHSELDVRDIRGGAERTVVASSRFDTSAGPAQIGAFSVSNDGTLIEMHVFASGAAESDVHVLRVADGTDVEPPLHQTVFDYTGFTTDDRAILYAQQPVHSESLTIPDTSYDYMHRIGTSQQADKIVFGRAVSPRVDVPAGAFAFVDVSGPQAVAEVRDVAAGGSRFYTAPSATVGKPDTPWRALGSATDGYTDYALHGTTIDLETNAHAPNYRVVRASLVGAFRPREIVPEGTTAVVSGTLDGIPKAGIFALNAASDADYVQLLDRGVARMVRVPYSVDAKPIEVPLPVQGSVLESATDVHGPGALIDLTSWTLPGEIYSFDPKNGLTTNTGIAKRSQLGPRVAEELAVQSFDGTMVMASVVHRPGIALDGSHPLMLRVAGAYGFSLTPDYRSPPEAWLDHGGIYAVAHVRGGGELGEAWHRAGMGVDKPATWNDLIAVAQQLIAAGYTSASKLDLYGTTQSYLGGVASGIAIGRAIEVRPDLFAAAVIDDPAMDMLRSEKTALGRQSVSEFGTVTVKQQFEALLMMSPYEHVVPGRRLPPMLIRSFEHIGIGDDWEAAKMVARLQSASGDERTAFFDSIFATPDDKRSNGDMRSDAYAFLFYEDGATQPPP